VWLIVSQLDFRRRASATFISLAFLKAAVYQERNHSSSHFCNLWIKTTVPSYIVQGWEKVLLEVWGSRRLLPWNVKDTVKMALTKWKL